MVSALDSGASGAGSSPGRGHCVLFLGKTLYGRNYTEEVKQRQRIPQSSLCVQLEALFL